MPYSSQYTLEESTEILKTMEFPLEFLKEGDVFTDKMIDAYIGLKYEDVQRLRQSTHPCEFEMYYSL